MAATIRARVLATVPARAMVTKVLGPVRVMRHRALPITAMATMPQAPVRRMGATAHRAVERAHMTAHRVQLAAHINDKDQRRLWPPFFMGNLSGGFQCYGLL